jgi:hypothetical protein
MKSSTFTAFAIGTILALYAGMAALDSMDEATAANAAAIHQCGNASFIRQKDGTVKCIVRKPLNGSRVKQ